MEKWLDLVGGWLLIFSAVLIIYQSIQPTPPTDTELYFAFILGGFGIVILIISYFLRRLRK
jgi:hypothetical protein